MAAVGGKWQVNGGDSEELKNSIRMIEKGRLTICVLTLIASVTLGIMLFQQELGCVEIREIFAKWHVLSKIDLCHMSFFLSHVQLSLCWTVPATRCLRCPWR